MSGTGDDPEKSMKWFNNPVVMVAIFILILPRTPRSPFRDKNVTIAAEKAKLSRCQYDGTRYVEGRGRVSMYDCNGIHEESMFGPDRL